MNKPNFIIDSKDKNILSKGAKIFHYVFGLFFIITSLISIYRFDKENTSGILLYLILLVGILWIVRGLVGRNFIYMRRYISLTEECVNIKKPFKKEIQLSKDSIKRIALKPSKLDLKTKDYSVDFDLSWITYIELQQLRERFTEFCNLNKIEIE